MTEPTAAIGPPECNHEEWALGCERCFWEMSGIAMNTVRTQAYEDQVTGAILFNWHVMVVLRDLERQLLPLTQGMDIRKNEIAKELIANLKQITTYLVQLVADPDRLMAALADAALIAQEVKKLKTNGGDPTTAGATVTQKPTGLVITG